MSSGVADVAELGFLLMSMYFLQDEDDKRAIVARDNIVVFFML
jgi:hypothetical protein